MATTTTTTTTMSTRDRLSAASIFLLQSPPGEVNDVFSDIRLIVSDDTALENHILPTLSIYNRKEFTSIQSSSSSSSSSSFLITDAGLLPSNYTFDPTTTTTTSTSFLNEHEQQQQQQPEERYFNPNDQTTYLVDHLRLLATSPIPIPSHTIDSKTEQIRSKLNLLLGNFVQNHYSDGKSCVYTLEDTVYKVDEPASKGNGAVELDEIKVDSAEDQSQKSTKETTEPEIPAAIETEIETVPTLKPKPSRVFALYFIGNKYNPSNYWTGRWKSIYTVNFHEATIEAKIEINVHYYEQGNVQLSNTSTTTINIPNNTNNQTSSTSSDPTLSTTPSAELIISLIKTNETNVASQLAESFTTLSEEGLKNLRRTLPKNKCKIDWEKVGHYKLGKEMGGGAGGGGGGVTA